MELAIFQQLLIFTFSAAVTPGPNNVMLTASGVNYGIRRSLPHAAGICVGFPLMVIAVGLGLGVVFERYPVVHEVIKLVGLAYMMFLAWKIATAAAPEMNADKARPLSFVQAALFQWVNAKAWIMASGAIAVFTSAGGNIFHEVLLITLAFAVTAIPSVLIWLCFGAVLKTLLTRPRYLQLFNWGMALLLVISVLPVVVDLSNAYLL